MGLYRIHEDNNKRYLFCDGKHPNVPPIPPFLSVDTSSKKMLKSAPAYCPFVGLVSLRTSTIFLWPVNKREIWGTKIGLVQYCGPFEPLPGDSSRRKSVIIHSEGKQSATVQLQILLGEEEFNCIGFSLVTDNSHGAEFFFNSSTLNDKLFGESFCTFDWANTIMSMISKAMGETFQPLSKYE